MIIERKEYLEKLIAWKDKQLIKIVTGVRRCGKSMLLEIYRNYLKEHGVCKSQYKNVGLGQYNNVGFTTFLYCLFNLHLL